eukprot:Rmarinus@m.9936
MMMMIPTDEASASHEYDTVSQEYQYSCSRERHERNRTQIVRQDDGYPVDSSELFFTFSVGSPEVEIDRSPTNFAHYSDHLLCEVDVPLEHYPDNGCEIALPPEHYPDNGCEIALPPEHYPDNGCEI